MDRNLVSLYVIFAIITNIKYIMIINIASLGTSTAGAANDTTTKLLRLNISLL